MPDSSRFARCYEWLTGGWFSRSTSSDQTLQLLAENGSDVIFRFGPDGRARYMSPSVERMLGYSPSEIYAMGISLTSNELIHPEDLPLVAATFQRHFSGDLPEVKLELRVVHRDGGLRWVQTNCSTVADSSGQVSDIVFTMRDISEIKALEAQLQAQARTDSLTGLANRRQFDEVLEREWRRTLGDGSELSLLLIDADHFKAFNDANGHQVGDDCLRTLGATMSLMFQRAGDLPARYGGEEFAIILPNTSQAEAMAAGERLCRAIEALGLPHPASPVSAHVTVSVGSATAVAAMGGTVGMPQGLLLAADQALYRAKAEGRNRVGATLLLKPVREAQAA